MHNSIIDFLRHCNVKTVAEINATDDYKIVGDFSTQEFNVQNIRDIEQESKWDVIHIHGSYNFVQDDIEFFKNLLNDEGFILCSDINSNNLKELTKSDSTQVYITFDGKVYWAYITFKRVNRITPVVWFNINEWMSFFDCDKIVMIGMAKQEYKYIREWCDYHLGMGVDKIVLYDNNDVDGETYDELLSDLIDQNKLEIVNIRGISGVQREVYMEFVGSNHYDWCMVIDCDEFFTFMDNSEMTSIREFVNGKSDADAYFIPWICHNNFPTNINKVTDHNHPMDVHARRDGYSHPINSWMKTIYHHGARFGYITEHSPYGADGLYGDYHIYDEEYECVYNHMGFIYKYAVRRASQCCLRHYIVKDIETFFYDKYLRGHAGLSGTSGVDGYQPTFWAQNMNYFLEMNKTLSEFDQQFLLSKGFKLDIKYRPTVVVLINVINNNTDYYDRLVKIVNNCINNVDAAVVLMNIGEYKQPIGTITDSICKFQAPYCNYDWGFDLPKYTDMIPDNNWYIQEPLVLHLGYPEGNEDKYLTELENHLLNPLVFDNICRDLTFFNISRRKAFISAPHLIKDDNCKFWSANIDQLANNQSKHEYILGNTFLTNMSTYKELTDITCRLYWNYTPNDLESIQSNRDAGYSTIYEAIQFAYRDKIEDLILV